MSERANFIDLCLAGNALLEEIDDFVDRWHENPEETSLHEYLGMTEDEYSLWVQMPDSLPYIIRARREGRPFFEVAASAYQEVRLAARSNAQSKIHRLKAWLEAKR